MSFGHEIRLLDSSFATVGVLWNPFSNFDALAATVHEVVEGEDVCRVTTADFTYETQLTDDDATYYIRLINNRDATDIRTYHIKKHQVVHEGGKKAIEVEGERIWCHLHDRYRYIQKRDFANIAIGTLFTEILAGSFSGATAASSEFQIGTVASSSEVVDFFSVDWETPLGLIRRLCAKMSREMEIDESTDPITLDFPATIGNASSVARLRYGTNLRGLQRRQDFSERVTRMYAIGGGTPPATLSLSSLAGGDDYIDSANFDADENHFVGIYRNTEIEDITNRISDSNNPDLSGSYTAGLCAGWSKIGTPTVTENTDDTYFQYGTKSQKVVAADGEGVSVPFTASTDQRMTGWVNVYVSALGAAGVLRVEFTDGDGIIWQNGEGLTSVGAMATVERQGLEFTDSSGTLKIYADGDTATFYVDAAFVDNGDQFKKFVVGDMVDVLYNEANNALGELDDDTSHVTYEVQGIDLFESFPDKYPDYQIELGDTITVEDYELPALEAALRIKEKSWSVIRPENTEFQVGKVLKTYADFQTETARKALEAEKRERTSQDRDTRAAATPALTRPVGSQVARFDGAFTSTAYNGFSWAAGTLYIGADIQKSIGSGSHTGLSASTEYWLYFDLAAPGSGLQITSTYATALGPRKSLVAHVQTTSSSDTGVSVTPVAGGRPQVVGDHIVAGLISVGGSGASDRLELSWLSQDLGLYRGGAQIVDLGDISGGGFGSVGLAVGDDPEGAVYVNRDGTAVASGSVTAGIISQVNRDTDEGLASPKIDTAYYANVNIATKTSGGFGPGIAYMCVVDNDDGIGIGFEANDVEGSSEAVGVRVVQVNSSDAGNDAIGVEVESVDGGATSGVGYGLKIDAVTGDTVYGVYVNEADALNYFAGDVDIDGYLEVGNEVLSSPTDAVRWGSFDLSAGNTAPSLRTEGSGAVGSGTPTQNRTVALKVNGTNLYLLASTSAT